MSTQKLLETFFDEIGLCAKGINRRWRPWQAPMSGQEVGFCSMLQLLWHLAPVHHCAFGFLLFLLLRRKCLALPFHMC